MKDDIKLCRSCGADTVFSYDPMCFQCIFAVVGNSDDYWPREGDEP